MQVAFCLHNRRTIQIIYTSEMITLCRGARTLSSRRIVSNENYALEFEALAIKLAPQNDETYNNRPNPNQEINIYAHMKIYVNIPHVCFTHMALCVFVPRAPLLLLLLVSAIAGIKNKYCWHNEEQLHDHTTTETELASE